MAWDGSGNFVRTNGTNTGNTLWQDDRDDGVNIRADRHDVHDEDIAGGLENTIARDGQNTTQDDQAILKYESSSNAFVKAGEVATDAEAISATAGKFPDAAQVAQSINRNAVWMWKQSATFVDSDSFTTDTTTTDDAGENVWHVGRRVRVYLNSSDAWRYGTISSLGTRGASGQVDLVDIVDGSGASASLLNENLTVWVEDARHQITVDSVSDLQGGTFPSYVTRIYLSGYYGVGTPGGGSLYRDADDTSTSDNGGTVFVDSDGVRWKRPVKVAYEVEEFGALGDGSTDDSSAFQSAQDAVSVIYLRPNTRYIVESTVSVDGGKTFIGGPGTVIEAVFTAEASGGYPNTLFTNSDTTNGNSSIAFLWVKFDFAKDGANFDTGAGLTQNAGIKLVKVDSVAFYHCELFDYVTNKDSSKSGKGTLDHGAIFLDACTQVSIQHLKSSQIREEGVNLYECENVEIHEWDADGSVVNTSSHAGFWYCDGLTVRNARIVHTGGSVLNCFSRNVLYENIRVNSGSAQAGRGFDFSNELDAQSFSVGNIHVKGCHLNVTQYGIQIPPAPTAANDDVFDAISIEGCYLDVAEDSSILLGIRLHNPRAASVRNNYINLGDSTGDRRGNCVQMSFSEQTSDLGVHAGVVIADNYMRGLCGLRVSTQEITSLNSLKIKDNYFEAQDLGALSSSSGASMFVNIYNTAGAAAEFVITSLEIMNNECHNLEGGYLEINPGEVSSFLLKRLIVDGNLFENEGALMDRGARIRMGTGTSYAKKEIVFTNNRIVNDAALYVFDANFVEFRSNLFSWNATPPANGTMFFVDNPNGIFLDITENRSFSRSTGENDVVDSGANNSFDMVNIRRNATIDASGSLVYTHDFTNTALPN